jgi:hypothetical protein
MASTPVILLVKRSGNAADRPSGITIQAGEAALAFGAADPGLYFKDSAGEIRKVGPPAYSTTAPNAAPVGLAGNSVGELWVDSSTSAYYLRVWTGSGWQKIGAAFADDAQGAIVANSAILASGALFANNASGTLFANSASGALFANSATVASGALFANSASGALFANSATIASGALFANSASGALFANSATIASGALFANSASGALFANSATVASGALFANSASGALFANSATIASGALFANSASGVLTATGVSCADIFTGTLTDTGPSGSLRYKTDDSGSPSGLYVAYAGGWALV